MIKELEGITLFFQADSTFNKYSISRPHTETEKKKIEEFNTLFNNIHRKMFGVDGHNCYIGYLDSYGYIEINDAEKGCFSITPLGDDANKISIWYMNNYLFDMGSTMEALNRHKLEEEFINRYGSEIRYSCLFYPVLYAVSKWNIYYDGNIHKDVIEDYEGYLNYIYKEDNVEWHYDNINSFNFKKIERTNQYAKK